MCQCFSARPLSHRLRLCTPLTASSLHPTDEEVKETVAKDNAERRESVDTDIKPLIRLFIMGSCAFLIKSQGPLGQRWVL
ncbi:hypothetical protein Q8A67_007101 [Cirrhinus molitorella]|uniref:Uncharacterized protein n=1 Tax=Cirrhinus molitorella TaxID=172907 RepID=A0AA88Q7N3_9TELE|nr:hypothetical protein Q8A67_007101 [Cirrhinus molitorella]